MSTLLTAHPLALRILMTEELYQVASENAGERKTEIVKEEIPAPLPVAKQEPPLIVKAPVAAVGPVVPSLSEIPKPVEVNAEAKPVPAEPVSFSYLGDNNKYLLVLVRTEGFEFTSPKNIETLGNILKGKQMEIKDIALVNLDRTPGKIGALRAFFASSKIVMFGVNPHEIGLPTIASNEIVIHDGLKILATYSFDEMYADEQKKRAFWLEMKKL